MANARVEIEAIIAGRIQARCTMTRDGALNFAALLVERHGLNSEVDIDWIIRDYEVFVSRVAKVVEYLGEGTEDVWQPGSVHTVAAQA